MPIDDAITNAVKKIIPICVPEQYAGDASEYCTYNYTELPESFGDNVPECIRYQVQVHWLFPWRPNISADSAIRTKKQNLRAALAEAGFTWATITPSGDGEWEHFIFECEYCDGDL